jgi:hypothetical protein
VGIRILQLDTGIQDYNKIQLLILSLSTLRNAINLASSLNGGSSIFLSIPARILNLEGGFFFKGMYKNIITVAAIGK